METFKDTIIFSQQFPDTEAVLKEAEDLRPDGAVPTYTFEDMIRQIKEKYTLEPRPDAAEKSEQFITQAIAVCRDFEIDTEIRRRRYDVVATMDIYCGWYGGPVKHALGALLRLADDFTLSRNTTKSEFIRISMAYRTHDVYSYGQKVEW